MIFTRPLYVYDWKIAPVVTHAFGLGFNTSTFTKLVKVAKIKVLHKGGAINNLANYRPTSILPVFSTLLGKIIHIGLTSLRQICCTFKVGLWFSKEKNY